MSFLNDLRDEIHAIESAVERVDVTGVKTIVQTVVEKQEETDKKMNSVITDVSTVKATVQLLWRSKKRRTRRWIASLLMSLR